MVPVFGYAETGMTALDDPPPLVPRPPRPYLGPRRVMLWLSSKAIYPRDLNFFEGICPCPVPWGRAYGAHLVNQVRGDKTVLHGSRGAATLRAKLAR